MTKPHFITLTGMNGSPIRVAAAHVIHYGTGINGGKPSTYVDTTSANIDGSDLWVTEPPEQIDTLLGVTADPLRDAAPAMLEALQGLLPLLDDGTDADPEESAIAFARAALSQATGATSPASQDGADHTDLLKRARVYVESCAEGDPESKAARLLADMDAALSAHQAGVTGEAGKAIAEIAAERRRQIEAEGWTAEHDDRHDTGEMPAAAACYATAAAERIRHNITILDDVPPKGWPWSDAWWKPQGNRRDLIKAGALIVAELERLDRAAALQPQG